MDERMTVDSPFWRTISSTHNRSKTAYYSSTGRRVVKCFGETNGRHVLTQMQVDQLRAEFAHTSKPVSKRALGRKYNISPRQVDRILGYENWR